MNSKNILEALDLTISALQIFSNHVNVQIQNAIMTRKAIEEGRDLTQEEVKSVFDADDAARKKLQDLINSMSAQGVK